MLTLVYSFDTSPLHVLGHLCIITVKVFQDQGCLHRYLQGYLGRLKIFNSTVN